MAMPDDRSARAFTVKPSRRERRDPNGRWGLTAQRGPSRRAAHALNAQMRPSWNQLHSQPLVRGCLTFQFQTDERSRGGSEN
jgi:hypothetical protein